MARVPCLVFLCLLSPLGAASALGQTCPPDQQPIPLPTDTLLHVENEGITRLFARINDDAFKLVTDPSEVGRSGNAFPMPQQGPLSINIAPMIDPDGDNCYAFTSQGPSDAQIQILIANTKVPGQDVSYTIGPLGPLPDELSLLHNWPNPFATSTRIRYTIPESRISGVPTTLVVYDLLGRRVATLVDDVRFPGDFVVEWTGTDGTGAAVPAGTYLVQLVAGASRETIKVVRVR